MDKIDIKLQALHFAQRTLETSRALDGMTSAQAVSATLDLAKQYEAYMNGGGDA